MAEIPVPTRVAVLEAVLRRDSQEQILREQRITPDAFRLILTTHGYPDTKKMQWAADVMKGDIERGEIEGGDRAAEKALASGPCPHKALIKAGKKSSKPRTRNLAAKVEALLKELGSKLDEERAAERAKGEAAARAAAARKAAAAKKELDRVLAQEAKLKERKAAAQAALEAASAAGVTAEAFVPEVPAKEVRAWAATAGVDCPATGRIPQAVRDAYDAAHAEEPAA